MTASGRVSGVGGITWTGDLPRNLVNLDSYVLKRMAVAAHSFAPRAESRMKATAPWTDRTGAARNGLTARPEISATSVKIVLSHGVDYGIWLEIAHSGAYAVIIPSVIKLAPQFMALASRLIFVDSTIGKG